VLTINQRLKELRTHLGMTQKQLSLALGVKPSYYSDLENGHRTITGKFIEKLNKTFAVSADWMYTGKGTITTLKSNQLMYPSIVPSSVPLNDGTLTDKENTEQQIQARNRINKLIKQANFIEGAGFPEDYFNETNFYLKSQFEKKLFIDILNNYQEIKQLQDYLSDLQTFEYMIGNLNYHYFKSIDIQFHSSEKYFSNGVFNYEKYRDDYFAELRKLDTIRPALLKISTAIKEFYDEMKSFDIENIIEGYHVG
jgi:transcriptional regulator with XRE-family HTH domain